MAQEWSIVLDCPPSHIQPPVPITSTPCGYQPLPAVAVWIKNGIVFMILNTSTWGILTPEEMFEKSPCIKIKQKANYWSKLESISDRKYAT